MARAWNVVVGVACACLCSSARAEVVKLAELEQRALSQRAELGAGKARVAKAEAGIDEAEAAYYPTISAGVDLSVTPGRDLIEIPDPTDPTNRSRSYLIAGTRPIDQPGAFKPLPRYGASLSARGTLYDFGRTRSTLAAARAAERAAQADARARGEGVVLEVRAAYLRWSVAQALWEIAEEARRAAEARAAKVSGLIAEGAAAASAQTGASLSANAAASEAARAMLELESARLELGYLSARDLGPDAQPDPQLLAALQPPPAAGESAADQAALSALESAQAAAEARTRMQDRLDAPVLAYRVNAGIEGQSDDLFPNFAVGVGLSLPLWDAGATKAAEAGARAEAAELTAQTEAERARQRKLRSQRKLQADHALRLLGLAEQGLQLAETRVQQLESGTTLASAEQEALAAAEADRARARADVVRARASCAQLQLGLL